MPHITAYKLGELVENGYFMEDFKGNEEFSDYLERLGFVNGYTIGDEFGINFEIYTVITGGDLVLVGYAGTFEYLYIPDMVSYVMFRNDKRFFRNIRPKFIQSKNHTYIKTDYINKLETVELDSGIWGIIAYSKGEEYLLDNKGPLYKMQKWICDNFE